MASNATVEDLAKLVVQVELQQARVEKQAAAIAKAAERSANQAQRAYQAANANVASSFQNTGQKVVVSLNQQKAAAQNLAFQLNDIGTQLASGTSPWRVMAQQVGQVVQALQQAGGGGGALRALGGAVTSLVNPVGLATVAIGGLTAAAISYFTSTGDSADQVEETLKGHSELIRRIKDAYGEAAAGLNEYSRESKTILNQDIRDQIDGLKGTLGEVGQSLRDQILAVPASDFGGATNVIQQIDAAVRKLEQGMAEGKPNIRAFVETLIAIENASGTPDSIKQLIQGLRSSAEAGLKAQRALEPLEGTMNAIGTAAGGSAEQVKAFSAAIDELSNIALPAMSDMERATKAYNEALKNATTEREVREAEAKFSAAQERIKTAQLPTPTPRPDPYLHGDPDTKSTKTAERAATKAAREIDQAIAAQTGVAVDVVKDLVGLNENANRGAVNAFLKAGGVDLDAAQKAWCAAFVNSALAQVGVKGSGSNIATDFLNWGQNVNANQVQRGDVLVQSRGKQAGETGGHVGFATGQVRFKDGILELQQISGNAADSVKEEWIAASETVVRRATEAMQLPADGLRNLSEASKAAIKQSEDALKAYNDQQRQAQALANELGSTFASAFSGFVQDIVAGKDAAEALSNMLGKIGSKLLDIALNSVFQNLFGSLLGGGGSLLGGAGLGVGLYHKGGKVGRDASGSRRVSPGLFAGAPRYHSGGIAGLKPGEIPAILQHGEVVLPRSMSAPRIGGMGGREGSSHGASFGNIAVSIDNRGNANLDEGTGNAVGRRLKIVIQEEVAKMQRPGGLLAGTGPGARK